MFFSIIIDVSREVPHSYLELLAVSVAPFPEVGVVRALNLEKMDGLRCAGTQTAIVLPCKG